MMEAIRCSIKQLVHPLICGLLLRHGCTKAETDALAVECGGHGGLHPTLATVTAGGQEILRIDSLEDLDRLTSSPTDCSFLARRLKSIKSNNRQ